MIEEIKIKDGYKQTEVGVIPEDWSLITYDEAFNFLTTATYSRAELSENGNIGYVHYGDIHTKWEHFLDFSKTILPQINNEQVKLYPILKEGDLIMADASEDYEGIGVSVEVRNLGVVKAISGLHTFLLRDKKQIFSDGYKAYIHKNKFVKAQMDRLATGLKVYGVSKGNLKLIKIPLPPTRTEQTAIATALSDMDALIAAQKQLIAKKRAIKQGAMQELLKPYVMVNGELLMVNGKPKMKEGWEEKTLGEIAEIRKGQLITSSTKIGGDIPVIAGGKTPAYYHKFSNRKGKTITISGSGANAGYVGFHNYPIFASDCSTINESKKYSIEFIYFFLLKNQEKIYKAQTGGAQPHIHPSDLNPVKIPIPKSIKEQTRIAKILSDMDTEIEQLEAQLSKYRQIKAGMMQELLTGKRRLI